MKSADFWHPVDHRLDHRAGRAIDQPRPVRARSRDDLIANDDGMTTSNKTAPKQEQQPADAPLLHSPGL